MIQAITKTFYDVSVTFVAILMTLLTLRFLATEPPPADYPSFVLVGAAFFACAVFLRMRAA